MILSTWGSTAMDFIRESSLFPRWTVCLEYALLELFEARVDHLPTPTQAPFIR